MRRAELGPLEDPTRYWEPLILSGCDIAQLLEQLRVMMLIRKVEQHLAGRRRDGVIGGPVHLGVGQEAVAVGITTSLRSTDRVFGAHRSHSHLLALGSSVRGLFAEVLGRDTGLSRGMGGSMHLWDQPRGFFGSVPIVAGTISLAVGAALAAQLTDSTDIAVSYFGDGAAEEGVVHESLNLAAVMKLPVLFVVENNLFSSHMHISLRQPATSIARFAEAHMIPFEIVDGNDVVAVAKVSDRLVSRARSGAGPGLIEAVTSRWYGHVDWREDIDVGVNRSTADLANWRRRDPIARLKAALIDRGDWTESDHRATERKLESDIEIAWDQAMRDPYPSHGALLSRVYAQRGGL